MESKKLALIMGPDDMAAVKEARAFMRHSTDTATIRESVKAYMPHQRMIKNLREELAFAKQRIEELELGIIALDNQQVWIANMAGIARKQEGA